MAELRCLHEATVAAEEIDHLGHMNVRFYLEKALRATHALAADHGIGADACLCLGAVLEVRDVFTRHYREQLVGAPLAVMGGVLGLKGAGLRVYHELVNTAKDELAATFVHELQLRDQRSRRALALPQTLVDSTDSACVAWPEHGRPRTLDLDRVPPALTLAVARGRGLALRSERVVRADECDADGFFPASRYQDLVWGGDPNLPRMAGVPVFETEKGGSFGWATLESRGILAEVPRAGARIQSFGAEVEFGAKTSCRHYWVFDLDRGALLCSGSMVNLAFDIVGRRSIEIPPRIRAMLEAQYHPDLR